MDIFKNLMENMPAPAYTRGDDGQLIQKPSAAPRIGQAMAPEIPSQSPMFNPNAVPGLVQPMYGDPVNLLSFNVAGGLAGAPARMGLDLLIDGILAGTDNGEGMQAMLAGPKAARAKLITAAKNSIEYMMREKPAGWEQEIRRLRKEVLPQMIDTNARSNVMTRELEFPLSDKGAKLVIPEHLHPAMQADVLAADAKSFRLAKTHSDIVDRVNIGDYPYQSTRLKTVLQHDELYKEYPQLADLPTYITIMPPGTAAFYNRPTKEFPEGRIFINARALSSGDSKTMQNEFQTVIHEAQHAIDGIEGRLQNSLKPKEVDYFIDYVNRTLNKGDELPSEVRKLYFQLEKARKAAPKYGLPNYKDLAYYNAPHEVSARTAASMTDLSQEELTRRQMHSQIYYPGFTHDMTQAMAEREKDLFMGKSGNEFIANLKTTRAKKFMEEMRDEIWNKGGDDFLTGYSPLFKENLK